MKKMNLVLLLVLACTLSYAQELQHVTMKFQGLERECYMFVPENLRPERPLVIELHGYGGSAEKHRPELVEAAREHGFALCIPQGYRDPSCRPGWNVRYPAQAQLRTDDVAFMKYLVKKMSKKYNLNPKNAFLTGMSNGGEMCYLMACKEPRLFKAIASVAGLTLEWMVRECGIPSTPVPFIEIHGTEDRTSEWLGDPFNEGGWGAYMSVPMAVARISAANGCTYEVTENLPLLSEGARQVILHKYLGGEAETRLYEVIGGKHSWHLKDLRTAEVIIEFFEQNL